MKKQLSNNKNRIKFSQRIVASSMCVCVPSEIRQHKKRYSKHDQSDKDREKASEYTRI